MLNEGKFIDLYLDIDGVFLAKNQKVPLNGLEFLEFCINNFNCYWLSTHCRNGENKAVEYLLKFYPLEVKPLLQQIRPAFWDALKTEGINFSNSFFWLDDYFLESEFEILAHKNKTSSIIKVDLSNPNELHRLIRLLK